MVEAAGDISAGREFWSGEVIDMVDRQVFEALSNPRWDWRTVRGICSDTGLDSECVKHALHGYPHLIRRWPSRNKRDDNGFFALANTRVSLRERIADIISKLGTSYLDYLEE